MVVVSGPRATARVMPWSPPRWTRSTAADRCWWPPSPTHAAEVLGELLPDIPAHRRCSSATPSAARRSPPSCRGASGGARRPAAPGRPRVSTALDRVTRIRAGIVAALEQERRAATLADWQPLLPALSHDAPAVFEPDTDLAAIRAALHDASRDGDGWWSRWRRSPPPADSTGSPAPAPTYRYPSYGRRWTRHTPYGPPPGCPRTAAPTWPPPGGRWPKRTSRSPRRSARRCGTRPPAHDGGPGMPGAPPAAWAPHCGPDATAAGKLLAALDADALVRALPLWVGTVADVEDLLPPRPACSTWWCSTRRRTSTNCGPPRCWPAPAGRWSPVIPGSCGSCRSCPTRT